MNKVNSFYVVDNRWSLKFYDGSELETEESPLEYEYIGESMTLEPLNVLDNYCFEAWWNFNNGLCPIRIKGKWGFVNSNFEIVIQPHFDFVGEIRTQKRACWRPEEFIHRVIWDNGICKARVGRQEVHINKKGEILSKYETVIKQKRVLTINDIIELCHESLPVQWKPCPWKHPELQHGIPLLASDETLNCYMSAYGDMHVAKCRAAMMNFPFDKLVGTIEIVDWGCGQGIGSATIIEILKQRNLLNWVKKITLIEPSPNALQRAIYNISKIVNNNIEIDAINKFMPTKETITGEVLTSIGYRHNNIIHIFSNILDVKAIDLVTIARMVASSYGNHFVLCMGPKNSAAYRIEQFCSIFGKQNFFSQIDSARYGRTQRTGHSYTCVTRCFEYNGAPLDLNRLFLYHDNEEEVYNDYDIRLQWQNKVISHQKARVAYRLQNILSMDDIMYIDPVINEVVVDFIIVRPNRGILLLDVFEENLYDCKLSENKKEISVLKNENGKDIEKTYQSPIELINLCQTSIKDGIEELLMSTIESSRNFGLIKKIVVFTSNNIDKIKDFFGITGDHINYTYLFGDEFILKEKRV